MYGVIPRTSGYGKDGRKRIQHDVYKEAIPYRPKVQDSQRRDVGNESFVLSYDDGKFREYAAFLGLNPDGYRIPASKAILINLSVVYDYATAKSDRRLLSYCRPYTQHSPKHNGL
jgi:hypothetical protein